MTETSTPTTGTESTPVKALPSLLTLADRCDGSQSEAATTIYVRPNGQTLQFCDHHAREYDSTMVRMGFTSL